MKRLYIVLWSLVLLIVQAFQAQARQLSLEEALSRAAQARHSKMRSLKKEDMTLAFTSSVGATNCYYVVNRSNDRGFMILGADDCAPAVLGYVDHGNFDPTNIPPNMSYFLDRYNQQIMAATRMNRRMSPAKPTAEEFIPTIIQARWNQGEPYNRLCTDYDVLSEPTPTGCVATAIAQIMRHYEWPVRGKGSHSYTTSCEIDGVKHTIHPSASFDVEYEWDKMLFDYNNGYTQEQGDAVALLMRHVGVACDMGYSPTGSGAGVETPIRALATYFDYDKNMRSYYLSDYTDEAFATIIYEELLAGRALYAAGNGHAFLCDGYDGEGYFHWNWGWGGGNDGYFMLSGADAVGGFRDGLCIITGIQPNQGGKAPTVMGIGDYKLSVDKITDYSQAILFDGFMVNRSRHKIKVMYAFKFENEEGSYIAPGNYAELDPGYGLLPFDFRCQHVPNGTYKVYPAYRNMEDGTWHFPSTNPKDGTPTVTIDVPVSYIYNAEDLVAFKEQVDKGINGRAVIMNDIDLSSVCGTSQGSWNPIGTASAPFKGRVEGNGHVISNLIIRNSKNFQGLFGVVGDGTYINGITLDASCNIRGGSFVGGIAGGSNIGGTVTIANCGNEGAVYAAQTNAGGIIGCCYGQYARFMIENCYNTGRISGGKENGAISAWVGNNASVENCYNIGVVSGHDGKNSFVRYGSNLMQRNCYQRNTISPRQPDIKTIKATEIENGNLAYLLNMQGTQDNWYQNLDTTQTTDPHPVLSQGHKWVYACADGTFSNVPDDMMRIEDGDEYVQETEGPCRQVQYARYFEQAEDWEPLFVPFTTVKKDWGANVNIAKVMSIHQYDDNADGQIDRIEMEAATLNETDTVASNTPYLIRPETADTVEIILHRSYLASSREVEPVWSANARMKFFIQGTYAPYTTGTGEYVLSENVLEQKELATLLPQRWYVYTESVANQQAPVKHISLMIDGRTATGLGHIKSDPTDSKIYDLTGRPVNQAYKGIYIRKGRKILSGK